MASQLAAVTAALSRFMEGGSYWGLYRAVLDAAATIDQATDPTDADLVWFDRLHELVYMGSDGEVNARDRDAGLMSADDLRGKIRDARLQETAPRPS